MKFPRWLAGALLAMTIFAGCGSDATVASSPTTTPIPVPTVTPTSEAAFVAQACGSDFASSGKFSQVGDLIFTQPHLGGLSYPGIKLPDGLPSGKPYQLVGFSYANHPAPTDILANPDLDANPDRTSAGADFQFAVCNASQRKNHVLQAVSVKIAALTPVNLANTNVEPGCDLPFSSKVRQNPDGGCGGAVAGSAELFTATWPNTVTVGSVATSVTQVDNELSAPPGPDTANLYGNFPITLQPGKSVGLVVGMTYPSQPALYAFAFGVQADGAAAVYEDATRASQPILLAQHVNGWTGPACLNSTNLAQIPNDGVEKFYLCD